MTKMKTIGLIGGMSFESTIPYYQIINETIREKLGGLHSAKIILYSVEFSEIEECQSINNWEKSGKILSAAARSLEKAGADMILLCTNTMHKVAPIIESSVKIPFYHIADMTTDVLKENNIKKVGLLGTKYTMTEGFYKDKIIKRGIEVIIPESKKDIEFVNSVIFNELCLGILKDTSRKEFLRIIDDLHVKGAEGIILGCTEIGLLVKQKDTSIMLFDTTYIHAYNGALKALKEDIND